jgi:membrane protein DedA with SNARE-associated domain
MAEGFVGFVIPGDAALLIASAAVGSVGDFLILWAIAMTCSVAGNLVGFEFGRRVGPALRDTRLIRKRGTERWDKATGLLQRHGSRAVLIGRLIPFVRNVVPAVAGAAGVPYRTFLLSVSAGAAIATALPILFAVAVAQGVRSTDSVAVAAICGALAVLVAVFVLSERRRRARAQTLPEASPDGPGEHPDPEPEPVD